MKVLVKRIITTLFVFVLALGVFAPITFSLTQNNTVAVQTTKVYAQTPKAAADKSDAAVFGNIGDCGAIFGSIGNCIAYIFYFIPFYVGGGILNISARFLDYTATLTLSSKMFSSAGFLQTGWALMRDFANMFFIFILLYISLCIMLDIKVGGGDPKHMIVSVVIIAIVINFSMFVTDVVIDTSNTLALVFYNQITVKDEKGADLPDDSALSTLSSNTGIDKPKQIGLALASAFHPQTFTQSSFWQQIRDETGQVAPGRMILLLLVMGILYFVVAWSFFVAAFSFLGRMVELFVLIIFSPIAFITYIVPGMRKIERFGWSTWWSSLIKTAFAAPVYFLLILLITIIIKGSLFGATTATSVISSDPNAWIITLVGSVLVPAVFLWIMLTEATKYAQKASGTVGEKLGGMASAAFKGVGVMAGGAVLGVAAGGAAAVGRQTIGRTAERLTSGKYGQKLLKAGENATFGGWLARKTTEVAKGAQKVSYDVRQTGAGAKFAAATGMKMDSFGTFSIAAAKGGRESQRARQAAENEIKRQILQNKEASKPINKVLDKRKVDLESGKGRLAGLSDEYNKARTNETDINEGLKRANREYDISEKELGKVTSEKNVLEEEKAAAEKLLAAAKAMEKVAEAELAKKPGDSTLVAKLKEAKLNHVNAEDSFVAKDNALKAFTASGKFDAAQKDFNEKGDGVKDLKDQLKKAREGYTDASGKRIKGTIETKEAFEKQRHTVHEIEHGKNMEDQRKYRDPVLDSAGNPTKDASGKVIYKTNADGSEITKAQAMEDMSIHQLEGAVTNSENANFKEHMFNSVKKRYKDTKETRDNLGNITKFDTSGAVKERTRGLTGSRVKQSFQTAVVSSAPAFVAGTLMGGPLVGFAAALGAAAVGGGLEFRQSKKRGENINLDTQLNASNTIMKNVNTGKQTEKHEAERDLEIATIVGKPIGAVGDVINQTVAASGVKVSGSGAHPPKAASAPKAAAKAPDAGHH